LPEVTQCLPRGDELETSDSKIGKRQKQEQHHETPNDNRLKRDSAALIREQGRGGQFIFSGQGRSSSHIVTRGVTLTLKTSGSERLAVASRLDFIVLYRRHNRGFEPRHRHPL
jgi:hypothetical protein